MAWYSPGVGCDFAPVPEAAVKTLEVKPRGDLRTDPPETCEQRNRRGGLGRFVAFGFDISDLSLQYLKQLDLAQQLKPA